MAIAAAVAFLPLWSQPSQAGGSDGRPSLPTVFPGFSFAQGYLDGPFGRAIALYTNGSGHEDFTFGQLIVAGAERNRFRRLDVPTGMSPVRLFPDGTKVAASRTPGTLSVINLIDGKTKDYPLSSSTRVAPLAISPDGARVAYALEVDNGCCTSGLYVLDLASGESTKVAREGSYHAAFSPDGETLAYQEGNLVHLHPGPSQGMALPGPTWIGGTQAWTPDGKSLIIVGHEPEYYRLMDVRDGTLTPLAVPGERPIPRAWGAAVLGWRTPTKMLVSTGDVDGTTSNLIVEVDLASGSSAVLGRFAVGDDDDLAVTDVQLASGLVSTMDIRSGANPERGRWPAWLIITCLVVGGALLLAVGLSMRRRSSSKRSSPQMST